MPDADSGAQILPAALTSASSDALTSAAAKTRARNSCTFRKQSLLCRLQSRPAQ
jgi:hypothetical protein